jgi:hypothetical protein
MHLLLQIGNTQGVRMELSLCDGSHDTLCCFTPLSPKLFQPVVVYHARYRMMSLLQAR